MKKFLSVVLFVLLFSISNMAQTPTPTPIEDNDIVKISTTLIQIDVTVTDRSGKIIKDLKAEDFEIYENGKKQEITNLSFISNIREQTVSEANRNEKIPAPPPPAATVRPEQVRRTLALIVDDLTLSFESTYYVRRALKKFVDEQMQPGDLVAIIRTGAGIGALQQFTTDKRQLYAAIEKVRWNPIGSGGVSAFAPMESLPPGGEDSSDEEEIGVRDPEVEANNFRESVFATGTLGAINYVIRGMQDLPGRKSVMLFSDGFALFTQDSLGFRESSRVLDSLRRLVDLANRASVVVYTMDARGLQTLGLTAADDTSGRTPAQIEQALSSRRAKLFDTQDGLTYLAKQTGGLAVINNNDLSGGIRRMLDDQSYYLIGYQPDDETFDPKTRRFNKLEVKVKREGVRVRYRSGFFGISDEQIKKPNDQTSQERQIVNALTSPFAINEVSLRLNALFADDAKQGSYIRSLLHIRAQDLKFTDEADGTKKAVFDVLAMNFGDNGVPVDQLGKTFTINVKENSYQKILKEGFIYDFAFPVKKPGAYQLRIALLDKTTGKVGSANQFIEIPNVK
ncbi:MAG TPA: VWA domain-containing protein, partial [Pyrinomonadaceae bacterium]|nr:VWA domain-containing protein [Pyrinomonadaceae bacterium]